jgi:hypothetical protein
MKIRSRRSDFEIPRWSYIPKKAVKNIPNLYETSEDPEYTERPSCVQYIVISLREDDRSFRVTFTKSSR